MAGARPSVIVNESGSVANVVDKRLQTTSQLSGTLPGYDRTPSLDAFGRLRVSEPKAVFDSKLLNDHFPLFFTEDTAAAGSNTYVSSSSSVTMAVSTGASDRATRQTKRYFNYQSGKSLLVFVTFDFVEQISNVSKRVGYFDNNDGIFLQLNGTTLQIVKRTSTSGSPVDTIVSQSSFNLDQLDGTGPSGITIDITKSQILVIDIEWLGVGAVRCGFVVDGKIIYFHEFRHANVINGVYMKTPNLPVRWEILNTAGSSGSSMKAICCSVNIEGGVELVGVTRGADRGTTDLRTDITKKPLISIRLKSNFNRTTVVPLKSTVVASTGANFRWEVVLNPTITGGTAASWVSVPNSYIEYDVSQDGTVSGGIVLASGYGSNNLDAADVDLSSILTIASDYSGTSDVLVLAIQSLSVNEDFYGSIQWIEVI